MKKSEGFGLIPAIIAIVIIAAVAVAGTFVYQHNHKKTNVTNSSSQTAKSSTNSTPTTDPTANWKIYCDPNTNGCFKYPTDWSLSSSTVQGGVSVSIRNPSNVVLASYTNPFVKDSGTGDFYAADIEGLITGDPTLKVIGGIFTANSLPSYYLVDSSVLSTYPLTVGQTSQFPTAARYTDKNATDEGQLTAYLIGSGYSTIDQAKTWFSSPAAKTSLLILQSFYYKQ